MRYMSFVKVFLAVGIALKSGRAPAPVEVLGGGDAVFCRPVEGSPFSGYYSLDYLLTMRESGGLSDVISIEQSLERIGRNIQQKLPEFYSSWDEFHSTYLNSDFRLPRIWQESPNGLIEIGGEGFIGDLPTNCKNGNRVAIVQAAVRDASGPSVPPGKILYHYVPSVFRALESSAALQLSFIVVHEWLWDIVSNPEINRRLDHFLHSRQFLEMSTEDVRDYVAGMGVSLSGGPVTSEQVLLRAGKDGACALFHGELSCWGGVQYARSFLTLRSPSDFTITGDGSLCVIDNNQVQCAGQYVQSDGLNRIPPISRPFALVSARNSVCAKDQDGWVCWGGSYENTRINERVLTIDGGIDSFCYLTLGSGAARCIGPSDFSDENVFPQPFRLPALANGVDLSFYARHACILKSDGYAICFGRNDYQQAEAPANMRFSAIAAGQDHVCGITGSRSVQCWGHAISFRGMPSLSNPTQIVSGNGFSCALDDHGVSCWGTTSEWNSANFVIPNGLRW